jgi:mono/diheme cytochrome c family protein
VNIRPKLTGIAATLSLIVAIPALCAAEDTAALWTKHCASCHGADGKAATKMGKILKVEDLTNPEVVAQFDRDKMIASTKAGILKDDGKTPWMPEFGSKLSDEQIAALIDYVINDIAKKAE